MNKIDILSLTSTRVNIINLDEGKDHKLNLNLKCRTRKTGVADGKGMFAGDYTAILTPADEESEEPTFLVEYTIHVVFSYDDPDISQEEIRPIINPEVYPHLRSGIACLMGAAGIPCLILPPYIVQ